MKNSSKNEDDELVTKGYLKEVLTDIVNQLINHIDYKVKPFEEMQKENAAFKNQTYKNLDWLTGQYEKFDDKYDYVSSKFIDLEDRYNNHERRIVSLEVQVLKKKKQN